MRDLAVAFAAAALAHAGRVGGDEATARAESAIDDGTALERFRAMVEAQGGDPRVADDPWSVLPRAPVIRPLLATASGAVQAMDAEAIGLASGTLGAGRLHKGDPIDPAVGIVVRAKVGDPVEEGEPIGEVHARDEDSAGEAANRVNAAFTLGEGAATPPPLVYGWFE
jgi:pyrimidine-nucleoside phosphorylase